VSLLCREIQGGIRIGDGKVQPVIGMGKDGS